MGYQHGGVYHYVKPAFDQGYGKLSPGTVLLLQMLEDLFAHEAPGKVCFCFGDTRYKQEFGNVHSKDVEILLLKRTFANSLLHRSHVGFRQLVKAAKTWRQRS
jgi:CelD/BcsL family acetyltransferase involved in cellulose biosynthesis